MLFQVPEFFNSSFLQVKFSSGLHRRGLRDAGQQRQLLFLCRELCLTLSPRDPWYIQG